MTGIETGGYNIEFNPNNVIVDRKRTREVLKNFKKWADYRNNWKVYHSFSRISWNHIETVFIEEQRLRQRIEIDKEIAKARKRIEEFKIETNTQMQLQNLEQNMNSQSHTETHTTIQWNTNNWTTSSETQDGYNGRTMAETKEEAQAMDNATLQKTVDDLLGKYKDLRKWIRGAEWNWKTKNNLKSWLWENIESLQRMQRDLKRHTYSNLSTYKARVWELIYYYEHYEQVRQLVVLWQQTSDIHTIIDSKQDAKRARRQERRDAKYQQRMNEILHDVALTSMWNNDMERYEEYLEAVVNGQVEPSTHPFYTAHNQSFAIIQGTNPSLYNTLVPTGWWRINYSTYCQNNEIYNNNSCRNRTCCKNTNTFRRFGERFSNTLEQIFTKEWFKDPRQKEAWKNIWSLLAVWWAIFMWAKAIKSLKKDEKWERHWWAAAWWTAWTLAILFNDKFFQTLQDATNIHPAEKTRTVTDMFNKYWFTDAEAANIADKYVWAPIATVSALHFIPIYDLYTQHILEENNNGINFNYNNYERYLNWLGFNDSQKQQLLSHWQRLRDNNRIWLGLWTFWINTMTDLKNSANWSQTTTLWELPQVQEWWDNSIDRISNGINAKLFEHWLRAKDPQSLDKIIKEYDDENNPSNIKKLIVKRMKEWLLEISATDKDYNLEDMLNNPNVDIENMTMKWFTQVWWNEVKFDTYWDLFDTVYITDQIKYNFAWRPAKSDTPFHYSLLWDKWQLEFDDTKWFDILRKETDVIKWKSMMSNLKTIWKNKLAYQNYLNERRKSTKAEALTGYPLCQALWINFYWGTQEVIKLEEFLNNLKNQYWNIFWALYWDPYTINNLGQLVFSDWETPHTEYNGVVDVKLRKFKTIWHNSENKEKLLKFLNNPSNWMFKDPHV